MVKKRSSIYAKKCKKFPLWPGQCIIHISFEYHKYCTLREEIFAEFNFAILGVNRETSIFLSLIYLCIMLMIAFQYVTECKKKAVNILLNCEIKFCETFEIALPLKLNSPRNSKIFLFESRN